MKTKTIFLTCGIIGALYATNGYADNRQSILVRYACPDNCNVTNDAEMTKFSCIFSDNKDCGNPVINILEGSKPVPVLKEPTTNATSTDQKKSEPTTARAARVARPNTTKPTNNKPQGPDKSASGYIFVECPSQCSLHCEHADHASWCECRTSDGKLCEENVHTGQNKPVSF